MRAIFVRSPGLLALLFLLVACQMPFENTENSGVESRAVSYPIWDKNTVYTNGNMVSWKNHAWRASWWTLGEEPGTTGEWGVWKDQGVVNNDTVPPSTPGVPVVSEISSTSASIQWASSTDNIGVDHYLLSLNNAGAIKVTTNTYKASALNSGTDYLVIVKAVDASGNQSNPAQVSFATLPQVVDTIPPTAPGNFTASTVGSSSVTLTWNPSTDNIAVKGYKVSIAGIPAVTVTGTNYSTGGLNPKTTYTAKVIAFDDAGLESSPSTTSFLTLDQPPMPKKLLVGYWHNFDNGTGFIRLRDVPDAWDVINVAFVDVLGDRATAEFNPDTVSRAEFKADVDYLHSKGKKVVISVGGQNGVLLLTSTALRDSFVSSMKSVINEFGFDGIDLDVETGVSVSAGDLNLDNPTSPVIVNLIAATRTICDYYGPSFILSMAPEIAYVQGGLVAFGGPWGGYLPIIHKLRDKLTWLHVQHYNCGGNPAPDGKSYNQGTADFQVAMVDMLLSGFNIGGNAANPFPPLREDQVMIGLPATGPAAPSGGYINPVEMTKALNYIMKNQSFGGSYVIRKAGAYPGFRGLMAWSVNWDAKAGYEFTRSYRAYLNAF